ncbi:hypothetical protein PGT21_008500 [Puccinia graminis f. sp. tritici]|nr:hypothetical protein PGT21_008500 [Puccinia graminis f. sp. tritici]
MEDQIAIVIVSSVSITSGHQIGRANPLGQGPSNSPSPHGRKLYVFSNFTNTSAYHCQQLIHLKRTKFSPKASLPQQGPSAIDSTKPKLSHFLARREKTVPGEARDDEIPFEPTKGKGKSVDVPTTDGEDESDDSSDEESQGEVQATPTPMAKRGRPRKNIIQEAAKRMKKH